MNFDEWVKQYDGSKDPYALDAAEYAWNAAIEEAAGVCETAPDNLQDSTFSGAARAIRALKA